MGISGTGIEVLSEDQVVQFMDAFKLFDTNRDGMISTKELAQVLRYLGRNPTESDLQELVSMVDTTSTGSLDLPQFLSVMGRKISETNTETDIEEAFRFFDVDGNGYVNRIELSHVMQNLGQKLSEEEIVSLLNEADIDRDGVIDYEEFCIMMIGRKITN